MTKPKSSESETKRPWVLIIVALIGSGLIPGAFGIATHIYDSEKRAVLPVNSEIQKNLESTSELYATLFQVVAETTGQRAIIFKAHDAGTLIPTRSSVVAEVSTSPQQVFSGWQSQALDVHYIDLLTDLVSNNNLFVLTEDMPPGILSDAYQAYSIESSSIHYIGASKGEIYYLSVNWGVTDQLTPLQKDVIRGAVNKLRRTLKELKVVE